MVGHQNERMGSRTTDLRHSWSGWSGHAYLFWLCDREAEAKLHYDMENEVWVQEEKEWDQAWSATDSRLSSLF